MCFFVMVWGRRAVEIVGELESSLLSTPGLLLVKTVTMEASQTPRRVTLAEVHLEGQSWESSSLPLGCWEYFGGDPWDSAHPGISSWTRHIGNSRPWQRKCHEAN